MEMWVQGKSQDFAGCAFRFRQSTHPELHAAVIRRLQVDRLRIMDLSGDAGTLEMGEKLIPRFGADDV